MLLERSLGTHICMYLCHIYLKTHETIKMIGPHIYVAHQRLKMTLFSPKYKKGLLTCLGALNSRASLILGKLVQVKECSHMDLDVSWPPFGL